MLPDLLPVLPELLLVIGALVLILFGAFAGERSTPVVTGIALALLVIAGAMQIWVTGDGGTFGGAFVVDPFARVMKVITLAGSAIAIAMSVGFMRRERFERFEYPILVLLATCRAWRSMSWPRSIGIRHARRKRA